MEKIQIIEKAKGMKKEGAIKLLQYHQRLQKIKMDRLGKQMVKTNKAFDEIGTEIERREKEEEV